MLEISALERYTKLSQEIKDLTKQLDDIKSLVRNSVGLGETRFDGFVVKKEERFRVDLDKEKILLAIGADKLKECEKISSYEVLTVKRF